MRYALVEGGAVVKSVRMPSNFNAADVQDKGDWRPVDTMPDPAFDPDTHKLGGYLFDLVADPGRAQATREVVALTQDELDVVAEQQEREQAKTYYQKLKAGNATNAEVQRVVARLLRDNYG